MLCGYPGTIASTWQQAGRAGRRGAVSLLIVVAIGIPVGIQCFKVARLALTPFGGRVEYGGGLGSFVVNVVWIFLGGIELCIVGLVAGALCCITIVGIPAGIQSFKFAKLALMPFGSEVRFGRR